jgi:hypothetical protein
MKKTIVAFFLTIISLSVKGSYQEEKELNRTKYYDHNYFLIEGTTFTDSAKESIYDRFPVSYKDKVRDAVWNLSKHSAGISVRFFSNSTTVRVKWELLNDAKMNHMAETGIKGIDLYYKALNEWQYVNTARPEGKTMSSCW